ncbi:hypothetical protein BDR04DRAFT_1086492, partial [Suillus decipiens]
KLVTSVHFQSFAIVTDTLLNSSLSTILFDPRYPANSLTRSSYPLYFSFLSIQVRHHLFLPSSSH